MVDPAFCLIKTGASPRPNLDFNPSLSISDLGEPPPAEPHTPTHADSHAQHQHQQQILLISPRLLCQPDHRAMAQAHYPAGSASPTVLSADYQSQTQAQSQSQSQAPQHKRVYQACIPCRRRKVRCDLGSVDNPHDPPCVRCRRESKECFFSATRRKRKADDGEGSDADEYIVRNGRKRLYAEGSPPASTTSHHRGSVDSHLGGGGSSGHHPHRRYSDAPLTPGGSHGRTQPLRRPNGHRLRRDSDFGDDGDVDHTLENLEAKTVMRREVYGPHDALDLLYKAATDSPLPVDSRVDGKRKSATSVPPPGPTRTGSDRDLGRGGAASRKRGQPVDPELSQADLSTLPGYDQALKAWSRFRFVRAGWFTAQEAIEYIDYYYKYLSPLTPISPPTFSNPASHYTLLTDEPILTVTLLTIASRYRNLPGAGGHCRSHAIHGQLWTYLQGMIERCLWGQEAFGGGFCGSGSASVVLDESHTSSTAPWRGMRKGSLRTLGTIESLMILTEWHPRALHFPPSEATDELVLPSYEDAPHPAVEEEAHRNASAGFGGRRIESWLEPAWRSDRMCWMLLSTAMGLAYELGVFDDIDDMLKDDAITRPEYREEGYRLRAVRIKRLLLIYTTQLAGRLGWTSMAPEHLRKSDPAVARRRPITSDGNTPGTSLSTMSNAFNYIPDLELDDQIIHCWAGISNAMHMGNEKLFRSRKHTTEIIQSGKYVELLRDFGPLLRDWYKEFELFNLPPFITHILTIEYEYVRIYVNSLSLQAVVERCTNNAGQAGSSGDGSGTGGNNTLSPQTLITFGKLPLGQLGGFTPSDQEYVREVVEGSRNLLKTVVYGLLPGNYLKHAPVRTYFRIISGAMFLLKTFALGAPRSDVKMSIELMDSTVEALRNCVVDDVHLGIRFADLLESLTSRLRTRFIQAPNMHSTSGRGQTPTADGADGGGGVQQHGEGWVGGHAQRLREGLNGQLQPPAPVIEANNISATPFDLSAGTFPYPAGAQLGPPTPAAAHHGGPGPTSNSHGTGAGAHSASAAAAAAAGASTGTSNTAAPATASAGGATGMDLNLFEEWASPGDEMWYLPPGPAFFQNMENSAVAMTAEGVNVGGLDLLEYMAMDNPFNEMNG